MKLCLLFIVCIFSISAIADELCFSPVKEREGDKSTKRGFFQKFDYRVQVDNGKILKPSPNKSTPYPFKSSEPLVTIWLGDKKVESFQVTREKLKEGRNCIYFKNMYETWSIAERWQANKLCTC